MSGKFPKITVLIPTFNRAQYITECLEGIFGQTLAPTQIIVVNDGSTDHTREVLKPYMDKIDYLEIKQSGKPKAINMGIEKVSGEYLWIFDDDDVAFPDALKRFVEPLEKDPRHGFSFSSYLTVSENMLNGRIGSVEKELRIPDINSNGLLVSLMEWNFLGGGAIFARTSCYKKVGLFNCEYLRSQDYDMAIRLTQHFSGILVEGSATFSKRQHQGDRGANKERFGISKKKGMWLKYDQIIFKKLYKEFSLTHYLPSGKSLRENHRQAILQRIGIMASKLLIKEVMDDLNELANLDDASVFSEREYLIIRAMMTRTPDYGGKVGIFDNPEIFRLICRLSKTSQVIRVLQKNVLRSIFARIRSKPNPKNGINSIQRILALTLK